jgi:hypothetical protein
MSTVIAGNKNYKAPLGGMGGTLRKKHCIGNPALACTNKVTMLACRSTLCVLPTDMLVATGLYIAMLGTATPSDLEIKPCFIPDFIRIAKL